MVATAAAVLVLPFLLAALFNGRDRADVRGRRVDRRWRSTAPRR